MTLLRSSATIGGYTLISRVLGFLRDLTIASSLGASWLSDAFLVAFKIPNFLRRLFAEGAFNAAFVPMYAGMQAAEGQERANQFADEAYSFLVTVLLALSVVMIAAMPWAMIVLAPGFAGDAEKYDLTVLLTRITFPYIVFISVVSLLGGILNSLGRFAAVAATPIIMNLCLIIVPTLVDPWMPTGAHGLAVAVFAAGVAQMVWLMVFCRRLNVMPRLRYPRLTGQVKRLLRLIAPAALGAGVAQVNLFVDLIIASHLAGGVSYLYYADRLNELPLAVIGIAVGTALLPMLSRQFREGKADEARASLNRAVEFSLLLALPAAAALMTISEPLIRVLYERGAFSAADTLQTHRALIAFAAGLPAFVLIKVLVPAFYAAEDTKTPFKIATLCILVNFVLNLALIIPLKHVGMALATTIAGWLNVALLVRALAARDRFRADTTLLRRGPRMVLASGLMSAALFGMAQWFAPLFTGNLVEKTFAISVLVTLGMTVYGASALALRAVGGDALHRLRRIIKK